MEATYEISDRYTEAADANDLLYSPQSQEVSYQQTTRYCISYSGDAAKLEAFVQSTLLDSVSQTIHSQSDTPAISGAQFVLDYGMKAGALDLEKEAIMSYYRGLDDPGFQLDSLRIRRRVYLFADAQVDSKPFERDICNAAIHNWEVIPGQ